MVQCYACKSEYPAGTTLCERCKAPLPSLKQKDLGTCPQCHEHVPMNSKECPSCHIELIGENAPTAETGFPEEQINDLKQLNITLNKLLSPIGLELPLPPSLVELKELILRLSEEENLEVTVGKLSALLVGYARILGSKEELLDALNILGHAYFGLSDYYAGVRVFFQMFQVASQVNNTEQCAVALLNFGIGHEESGNYYTAEHAYRQAKRFLDENMNYELFFQINTNLFTSLMFQDKFNEASEALEELFSHREAITKTLNADEINATLFLMSQQLYWNQLYNKEFLKKQEHNAKHVLDTLLELLPSFDLRLIHFIMIERFCILAEVIQYPQKETCIDLLLKKARNANDVNEEAAMYLKLLPAFQEAGDNERVERFKQNVFSLEDKVSVATITRAIEVLSLEEFCNRNQIKIHRAMHYYPDDLTKVEFKGKNKLVNAKKIQFQPLETLYGVSLTLYRERVKAYFKDIIQVQATREGKLEVSMSLHRIADGKIGIQAKEEFPGSAPKTREIPFLQATETFLILARKGETVYGIELIGTEIQRSNDEKPVFVTYEIFGYYLSKERKEKQERKELMRVLTALFDDIEAIDDILVLVYEDHENVYYQPILRGKSNRSKRNNGKPRSKPKRNW